MKKTISMLLALLLCLSLFPAGAFAEEFILEDPFGEELSGALTGEEFFAEDPFAEKPFSGGEFLFEEQEELFTEFPEEEESVFGEEQADVFFFDDPEITDDQAVPGDMIFGVEEEDAVFIFDTDEEINEELSEDDEETKIIDDSLATANLASGTCGENVKWTLSNTGVLTISGTGDMYDYNTGDNKAPWFDYGYSSAVVKSGVTSIGKFAFAGCNSLTSISVSETVTNMNLNTQQYSSSKLESITVDSGNPVYCSVDGVLYSKDKTSLWKYPNAKENYSIPSTVTRIEGFAFDGCLNLTNIIIPDRVTHIGVAAFQSCTFLTSVTLPAGITALPDCVFNGCQYLENITIPDGVRYLGSMTFGYCYKLTNVTIPASVKEIWTSAFAGCTSLKDVYYKGTQSEWNAIAIAEDNDALLGANIHFEGTEKVRITTQPAAKKAAAGTKATFTVAAEGTGLTYQWQYKTPSGSWKNTTATGNKTAKLTVAVTAAKDGYSYRCKVTSSSGAKATSSAVKLTVKAKITTQPTAKSAAVGKNAVFTVEASGVGLTYQWQYKTATGTNWNSATASGNKTATLTVPVTAAKDGYTYRCKVTSSNGTTATSNGVKLTVKAAITMQPTAKTVAKGVNAKFTVKATGVGLTYQWQYKTATGTSWSKATASGNKTATLTVPATAARNGYSYRCIVTSSNGTGVTSNAVKLTVK